ncbi:MAG: PH domain-containing protein [Candidatus Odinarchaeota archaeon]
MESKSTGKKFLIGCGIVGAVMGLVCLVGFIGFMVWLATSPEGGVTMGNEIETYALEYIAEHNLVRESEDIIAYYDATIALDGSEAAILTTERVIYHKDDRTTWIELKDIEDIQHRNEGLVGDIIEVKGQAGKRLKIEIAPFNQGESFYNALIDAWEAAQQ